MKNMRLRLIVMNFLEFAAWGSYLTSMGAYLASVGLGTDIGSYYAMQGVASLFMPALMGMVADRFIPTQRLLSFCHVATAICMVLCGWVGLSAQREGLPVDGQLLFIFYALAIAFFMPTLALSYSVAYSALDKVGLDTVKSFPSIRMFGTIGFICAMIFVDLMGYQNTPFQFLVSAVVSIVLAAYALTLPSCPVGQRSQGKSLARAFGFNALILFKNKKMALFFIFSFLMGVSLQITNGYANPFIQSFGQIPDYEDLFFVRHSNLLVSFSQVSETFCILMIPFFLKRYGIKCVMLIAMLAWCVRFGFFAMGDPGSGVWLLILSCVVYGVAFDFFNISGSIFVDKEVDISMRSSAQGLFILMTSGLGSCVGSLGARRIVNHFVFSEGLSPLQQAAGWQASWTIFATYALIVAIAFAILFKNQRI